MIKMLSGYRVRAQIESGSKEVRAEPFANQFAAGNVKIVKMGDPVKDAWIEAYVAELLAFPGSPIKDQVDATSGAYTALQRYNAEQNINGADIGSPISTGRDTSSYTGIDDIGVSPDRDTHSGWDNISPDAVGEGYDRGGSLW
jgi:hypothetical protein